MILTQDPPSGNKRLTLAMDALPSCTWKTLEGYESLVPKFKTYLRPASARTLLATKDRLTSFDQTGRIPQMQHGSAFSTYNVGLCELRSQEVPTKEHTRHLGPLHEVLDTEFNASFETPSASPTRHANSMAVAHQNTVMGFPCLTSVRTYSE